MRGGIIAKKVGMSQIILNKEVFPVQILETKDCTVVDNKTLKRDGYSAIRVGAFKQKEHRLSKSNRSFFKKQGVDCFAVTKEFRVPEDSLLEVGTSLSPTEFYDVGRYVDVSACSKGHGFTGAMKRHNFKGLRASHGVSVSHRSHGSTGQCQDPGKVFKGKKMAGRMGNEMTTIQNLLILKLTEDYIVVKGSVPGPKGCYVYISDAIKYNFL